jgi:hypothetical protein
MCAVGLVSFAPAASAASNPALVHFDTTYSGAWQCTASSGAVRMNPGDSLTLTWSSIQPSAGGFTFDGPNGKTTVPMSTDSPSPVSFTSLGTYRLNSSLSYGCNLVVSVVSEPVPPAEAHDYIQQVGVPDSGSCEDVPNWVGHLFGFPIGGWSKSWAQWINGGQGGEVCTREVEESPTGRIFLVP